MGLAVGDDGTGIALPLRVVAWNGVRSAGAVIAEEARQRDIRRVVVGLPTRADGSSAPAAARSNALKGELETRGLEVVLHPEYLTTVEARRRARAAGTPAAQPVDHIAAQILVEDYLSTVPRTSR